MCTFKHRLVLCIKEADGTTSYYHVLHHFPKSVVFMWPVKLHRVPDSTHAYAEHEKKVSEPCVRPVCSLARERVNVWQCMWRSWLWQTRAMPRHASTIEPSVRSVLEHADAKSMVEVGNENAWWVMARTTIYQYVNAGGYAIASGLDLFDLLWEFSKLVLALSDVATLQIIHRRLATRATM